MNLTVEHNLTDNQLRKALSSMAMASGIESEIIETLQKASACDTTPKLPRHRAIKELYQAFQKELAKAKKDIDQYAKGVLNVTLEKALRQPLDMEQLSQLQQAILDRYGFVAAQLQSVDYQPPLDLFLRWKQLGLVQQEIVLEDFSAIVSGDMHFIRNAFLMGKLTEAVESGKSFIDVIGIGRNTRSGMVTFLSKATL